MNSDLQEIYNDNNYPSLNRLWNIAKIYIRGLKYKDVEKFIKNQEVYQLHSKQINTCSYPHYNTRTTESISN